MDTSHHATRTDANFDPYYDLCGEEENGEQSGGWGVLLRDTVGRKEVKNRLDEVII